MIPYVKRPSALLWLVALASQAAWAEPALKVTFAAAKQTHGQTWNGGVQDADRLRALLGWHLHDDDTLTPPSLWRIFTQSVGGNVAAPGVILDLNGQAARPLTFFTRRGDTTVTPDDILYGDVFYPPSLNGDVAVERVPSPMVVSSASGEDDDPVLLRTRSGEHWLAWISYGMVERKGYFIEGADQVMAVRSADGRNWTRPEAVTPPGDHFRVALGEDAHGRIWCVYGLQREIGSGDFNLYATAFEAGSWSDPVQLTRDARPDAFHRMATAPDGTLYLVWAGFRDSPDGAAPQSDILMRVYDGSEWLPETNLTESPEDDWEPAVAADSDGRGWVAWDAYRANGFDVLMRSVTRDGAGPLREVSATPHAEMRADVAADGAGRIWISWEEGAPNWGKDFGYQNPQHQIRLKEGGSRLYDPRAARRPRVAVLQAGQPMQPSQDVTSSAPEFLNPALFQNPRLAVDGGGRIWVLLRHQWRGAGRWGGHFFDYYATTWSGDGWISPVLLPGSTGRQNTLVSVAHGPAGSLLAAVVGDGRRMPVGLPKHHDISVLKLDGALVRGERGDAMLEPFRPSVAPDYRPTHENETADLARIHSHRIQLGGKSWKIVRGDLHRHTEISMDGAIDGSLYDAYRYALNAAQLDFLGVSDHNYGQWLDTDEPSDPQSDNEFQYWRTQKSADLFHVPGRFTPLYGYERTLNFPLGHRNIFHATRGVFSLRVPRLHVREMPELIESDPPALWSYLRRTAGIGIPHTPAATMGTNWRRRDDEVIPVTEIYQGDRNSYETQGGPRAAIPSSPGPGRAGVAPHQDGLVQNALGVGYRMGFIASSDHYSTHISYANLIVPDGLTTREDLMDAMRNRRTFASTDNIVVEFHADGHHQGSVVAATTQSPVFSVTVQGTGPIRDVEIIKNNRSVYRHSAKQTSEVHFEYRDEAFDDTSMGPTATIEDWSRPETGIRARPDPQESYYYVRVMQSFNAESPDEPGEVAWSSPIFVTRR